MFSNQRLHPPCDCTRHFDFVSHSQLRHFGDFGDFYDVCDSGVSITATMARFYERRGGGILADFAVQTIDFFHFGL